MRKQEWRVFHFRWRTARNGTVYQDPFAGVVEAWQNRSIASIQEHPTVLLTDSRSNLVNLDQWYASRRRALALQQAGIPCDGPDWEA